MEKNMYIEDVEKYISEISEDTYIVDIQKILIMALPKSVKKNFEKSTKFDKKFWTYIDLQINRLKEVKNKNTITKQKDLCTKNIQN